MLREPAPFKSRSGRKSGSRPVAGFVATLALLLTANTGLAVEGSVGFGAGSQYSDNVTLAPSGEEESAWMGVGTVSAEVGERTDQYELRAASMLEYVEYFSGPFEDDFLFSMSGSGNWALGEDAKWYVEDHFNQTTVDPLTAPVPTNRQDVNVFSTGPEIRFPLTRSQSVVTGGRYENFYFEESDTNNQRLAAYGRWLYAMDPRRDLSANVEGSATDFTSERYPDYRRADLFLRLSNRWIRASAEVDGGSTLIRRDRGDDVNGALARLGWHLPFNSHSGVDVRVAHIYSDVGTDILESSGTPDGPITPADQQVTGDIFYSRHAELAWHWNGMFTSLRVAGAVRDEDFEVLPADRRYEEGMIGIGRELSESVMANLEAVYRRADYREVGQVNTDRAGTLTFTYRINSRLSASFQVARAERESTLASAEFTENRYFLSIGYNQRVDPGRLPGSLLESATTSRGTEQSPATRDGDGAGQQLGPGGTEPGAPAGSGATATGKE